jgi:hypothetical protein
MIAFRIVVNGRGIVTAGLPGRHVVSAILTSAWRDKAKWSSTRRFLEHEVNFSVSGLDVDLERHLSWFNCPVKIGDRIEVEVIDADQVDSPVHRRQKRATAKKAASGSRARKGKPAPRQRAVGSGKRKSKSGSAQ